MKPNPWFRMYHEFATDPKVQMLCEADQRRFVMLLCFRCCNGDVTLHDDAIAFQLRVTPDEWAATKARLLSKNLIDDENKPVAWERRQYVSDRSNERVIRHREKKKQQPKRECNVTVTPPESETDTEEETDKKKEVCQSQPVAAREEFTPKSMTGQTDDPNYEKCKLALNGSTNRIIDAVRNADGVYGTKTSAAEWVADCIDSCGAAALVDAFHFLERCQGEGQIIRNVKAFLSKNAHRHVENLAAKSAASSEAVLKARIAEMKRRC